MASAIAWRSRSWRHSGAVMCRYVPSTMLFAASESAVTKKPRVRLMMRRSSSVRPVGSFQSAMARNQVVRTRGQVLLPGPLVLERHQLIDVGLAVDDALLGGRHATRRLRDDR